MSKRSQRCRLFVAGKRRGNLAVLIFCCLLVALFCGCQTSGQARSNESPSLYRPATLHQATPAWTTPDPTHIFLIDFATGFAEDSFTVLIGDTIVAEVEMSDHGHVPAEWLSLETNSSELLLTFRDNQQEREWLFYLDLSLGTYFSIDYADGELTIRQAQRPFLYR